MGTAGACSWTQKRQLLARAIGHCQLAGLLWTLIPEHSETRTLMLPLYSQGFSEVLIGSWAEGALMCVYCQEHQWQVSRTQVEVKSTESTGQNLSFLSLETGTRTSGYRAGIKNQWWPRNSNLPGPSEP